MVIICARPTGNLKAEASGAAYSMDGNHLVLQVKNEEIVVKFS